MQFNKLRDILCLRMVGEDGPFKNEELKAVIGPLVGPAVMFNVCDHGIEMEIVLKGERFDVMGVRCWRDWALGQGTP